MRIIDKNTDFYDYYQNVYLDNTITFDRTDSFLLTKSMMCKYLGDIGFYSRHIRRDDPYRFVLLQICNTFWLFLIEIKKTDEYDRPLDYTMELISTWKNYDKSRCLIKFDFISFGPDIRRLLRQKKNTSMYDMSKIFGRADVLGQAVDWGNYHIDESVNKHTIYKDRGPTYVTIEKHIPLLKACGIANCVDPLEIFLAFEEYFSLEKSSKERTASVGLTDDEKITNHGFDAKTSFRGKS